MHILHSDALKWKYYVVYCCWLCFEGVFLFFCTCSFNYPPFGHSFSFTVVIETKGRSLEETAALFDGDDALQQITETAAHHAGVTHDLKLDDVHDEKSSQ